MFLTCLVTNQVVVGHFVNTDFLLDKIVTSLVAKQVCGKTRKMLWQILLRKIVRTIFSTSSFCKNVSQPATWLLQDRFDSSVVKSTISLFNSFCRNKTSYTFFRFFSAWGRRRWRKPPVFRLVFSHHPLPYRFLVWTRFSFRAAV